MRLLADAGLNAYRFGIEWARIEPRPRAVLPRRARALPAHDRHRDRARPHPGRDPAPLHQPAVVRRGRRLARRHGAVDRFARLRRDGLRRSSTASSGSCTINEPNMLAIMIAHGRRDADADAGRREWHEPHRRRDAPRPCCPLPIPEIGRTADRRAPRRPRRSLRERTDAEVGWTVANRALRRPPGQRGASSGELRVRPGGRLPRGGPRRRLHRRAVLLQPGGRTRTASCRTRRARTTPSSGRPTGPTRSASRSATRGGHRRSADPGHRERHRHRRRRTADRLHGRSAGSPVRRDRRRRRRARLPALERCSTTTSGATGSPPSGSIAVDRETFERTPKPSLAWLGEVARRGLN